MKRARADFFWPSFTDLMTSLFFVMLVLYVLALVSIRVDLEGARLLKEVESSLEPLKTSDFTYDSVYKRFTLGQIHFDRGSDVIKAKDTLALQRAGEQLEEVINNARLYTGQNLKYLIVIEGMASNDGWPLNAELSYNRARAVSEFWKRKRIIFEPSVCEVMISGSGIGGVGRDSKTEANNQRIIIQILPKLRQKEAEVLSSSRIAPTSPASH